MRRGRLARGLTALSLVAGTMASLGTMTAAHATGGSVTINGSLPGTINYALHPQNTLRKGIDSACGNDYCYGDPTDTTSSDPLHHPSIKALHIVRTYMDAGATKSGYFTARMAVDGRIPRNGDPVTALPTAFTGLDYTWYFTTSLQDATQNVGLACSPLESNQSPDRYNRVYLARFSSNGQTCPGAKNPGDEDRQFASAGSVPVVERNNVVEIPHFASDHWWMALSDSIEIVSDGPGPFPGNHFCAPINGLNPPGQQCLKSSVRWGIYEGYSGVTSLFRQDQNVGPAIYGPTYISNSEVQVQVPYNPQVTGGVNDNLLIDDTTIFPTLLGKSGASVTSVVSETTGTVQVGTPTAGVNRVCPAGTSLTPDGPLPPSVGLPSNVSPDPQNKTCANYLTGLLTLQDWAPANAIELRVYPRAPSYLPSASSATCRYPAGQNTLPALGAPIALAATQAPVMPGNAVIGQSDGGDNGPTGLDPTPYQRPWAAEVVNDTFQASGGTGNRNVVVPGTGVPAGPSTGTISQNLIVGQNSRCDYTDWPFGIHTFQVADGFPMG